ncbi:MAG: hypothetical protein H6807_06085 [Planctomycetes bacterium]|nr:hypothetical protein [Planctomycetota bacterium]
MKRAPDGMARIPLAVLATLFLLLDLRLGAQVVGDERELRIEERYEKVFLASFGRDRTVDDGLRRDVEKAIARAEQHRQALLILEIDSGGGLVDAAEAIVGLIREHRNSEELRIIAWVPRQAYSAAAWIALSCRGLVIAPGAYIGDIQPLVASYQGMERAPEKVVTALTEKIRYTCQDNGLEDDYPRLFLEAMVDRDIEITRVTNETLGTSEYMRIEDWSAKTERQREGLVSRMVSLPSKALTTTGSGLLDFGFRVKLMEPPPEKLLDLLGTAGASFEKLDFGPRKPLGISLDFSLLLLIGGIVLVVLEIKTPGLGVFGIGGVALFVLFFLIRSEWSDASLWPIGLFLFGAFLLVVEVVIMPGFILPGIVGVLLILYSTWLGVAHPGETSLPPFPDLSQAEDSQAALAWAGLMIGGLVGGFSLTFTFGRLAHRLPILNKLVLLPPRGLTLAATAATTSSRQAGSTTGWTRVEPGEQGVAVTALRPSGVVRIGDRKVDVVTRGAFLEAGTPVRVVEVSGNRVVVRAEESRS